MEYSLTEDMKSLDKRADECLNPCSNGILSDLKEQKPHQQVLRVLILVLMEYSLTQKVEDVLSYTSTCLNPCSNGILSD